MKSWEYIIQTRKEHIDFINKIIEAYEGVGNVRTLDNQNGLIKIITNSYLIDEMESIINKLRKKEKLLKILTAVILLVMILSSFLPFISL